MVDPSSSPTMEARTSECEKSAKFISDFDDITAYTYSSNIDHAVCNAEINLSRIKKTIGDLCRDIERLVKEKSEIEDELNFHWANRGKTLRYNERES